MALLRMMYTSQAVGDPTPVQIEDLTRRSAAWNSQRGVTGYLAYGTKHFLQVLEGDRTEVNRVYHERIVTDPMHQRLAVIAVDNVSSRIFVDWPMGFGHITREHQRLLSTYFPHGELQPMFATPAGCLEFLRGLSTASHFGALRIAV